MIQNESEMTFIYTRSSNPNLSTLICQHKKIERGLTL
jgi:hypothetical protein